MISMIMKGLRWSQI